MYIKPLTINIVSSGCYTPAVRVKGNFCEELGLRQDEIVMIFPCDAKQHIKKLDKGTYINQIDSIKEKVSALERRTDRVLEEDCVILNTYLQSNCIQEIPFNRESYKEWCKGVSYILKGLQYLVPSTDNNRIYCFHLSLWEFFLMYIESTLGVIPTIESVNTMIG